MNIKKIKEHNPQSFLDDLKRVREIMVYVAHTNSYYKVGYGLISLKMKKWDLTTSKNKLNGTKISPACKTRHITWARI